MATELSSNWKKLQSKIKAESGVAAKRKVDADELDTRSTEHSRRPSKRVKLPKESNRKVKRQTDQLGRAKREATEKRSPAPPRTARVARVAGKPSMGVAQSSKITSAPASSVSPSLALWAADNDISPEDITEAYGLGIKNNALLTSSASRPNAGLTADAADVGKYIAMDCEMVGVGEGGYESALARVSVVDFHGRQVYDSFVRPLETVTDWRTPVSGVAPKHMAAARSFAEAQAQVAELLQGRILVGHDVRHDLAALMLKHPPSAVRDTARFSGFRKYGHGPKPALRVLAREVLGVEIQDGQHSSIEDARATMLLFRSHKQHFDVEHMAKFPADAASQPAKKSAPKKKTRKKRRN